MDDPLFGDPDAGGKRDVLEGRLIWLTHAPHETFAISQAEADSWRAQFEAPDTAELAGTHLPGGRQAAHAA